MTDRVARIRETLQRRFAPEHLEIIDDSWKHAGHSGVAAHGGGHFRVTIVAAVFEGKSRLACHRLVMDALKTEFITEIHALSIQAYSPGEADNR